MPSSRYVGGVRHPNVDPRLGVVGDDVLAHAAAHDADVHRDPVARVAQSLEREDLVRELLDRARPVFGVRASVGGMAMDDEAVAGESLPGGLQVAPLGRRLEDERGRDVAGRLLDERPPGEAAGLLVRGEEDAGGAAADAGLADRLDEDDEPRLHVVGAGAVRAPVLDPEGHGREGPDRPHRVDMAEQEERLALARQVDAEVVAAERRLAAVPLELGGDALRHGPQALGVTGR